MCYYIIYEVVYFGQQKYRGQNPSFTGEHDALENGTITQSAINRYESGKSEIPNEILLWYADFFDVSLDYIFCRTDEPQGKLYKYQPKIPLDDKKMEEFLEMCFEPGTPANNKLKAAIITMLKEGNT